MNRGHLAAALGARAAGFDAIAHVADAFAVVGAGFANAGAGRADFRVTRRTAEHEIRCDVADLGAVEHEFEVIGFRMLAAHFKAVRRSGAQAHVVAVGALIDAGLHLG